MNHVVASAAVPRILIVDDDPGTIRVLIQILKDLGRIDFATSGPQAIDMATTSCPDLILLDIEMTGMDGFAVCQTLKGNQVLADVPILFVADALANLAVAFHDGEATVTVADGLPTVSGYRSEL
ncbi:MAG TPA: response regulator, partial [Patescibacteria group bacterium]|nr:response regulator [Patescibacteria group bacterium]